MISASLRRRKAVDLFVKVLSMIAAGIGVFFLLWILLAVIGKGSEAFGISFFTKLPTPPGITGGGLANAMLGTIIMTMLGALFAIPLGMMGGIYLTEYGKGTKFADTVKFVTNVMVGIPSIIIGVFVYTLLVVPTKTFSGYAGAVSLGIIMLPVVVRTTEDMLNMVPDALREAALAMGAPRWRVTIGIVCREAKAGLTTGVLLAVARVSGETAPLLFTALNSPYWFKSLTEPFPNLTVTIFNYAMSPYSDWQAQAWGASLLIMAGVLSLNIVSRIIVRGKVRK